MTTLSPLPAGPSTWRRRQVLIGFAALGGPASRSGASSGRTWAVGPQETLTRVADALALAGDGDTITIAPGTYAGDVAVIHQRRLRIVGLGTGAQQPVLAAEGRHAEGKAIWVVRDGDIQIENMAFTGCRVPDANGAGIRFERGRLHVRSCQFRDNQMGLLTSNHPDAEIHIEGCEFSDAPDNPGALPHLLYVGRMRRLVLTRSTLRRGRVGHLLKCRARESLISHNRIDDSTVGQASYEIDLPNGGLATVSDNLVVQSPLTQNPAMLSFGAEGQARPDSRLELRRNTFINHRPGGGHFVQVWADRLPPDASVLSQGNQWVGHGEVALGPQGRSEGDRRASAPALTR